MRWCEGSSSPPPSLFLVTKLCRNLNPFNILLRFQILLPPLSPALATENSPRSYTSGQSNLFVKSWAPVDPVDESPLCPGEKSGCVTLLPGQERGYTVWVENGSCTCTEADQLWGQAPLGWVPCPEGGGAGSLRNWVFFPGFWVTAAAFQCPLKSTSRKLLIGSRGAH